MKAKSVIVIVLTLVIGFILGMLTSAQIRYHRLKPVRVYFSEERFRDGFYKTIQPDEQQKAKIDIVLDKYAKINSELQNNFRRDLDASMNSFRKEIDLNLTKEQIARLKEMDKRRQEMIRQNRKYRENDTLNPGFEKRHYPGSRQGPGNHHPRFQDYDTTRLPDNK